MELELKHLAPYMPYGLRVHYSGLSDDDISGEFTVIAYHVGNGVSLIDDGALEEGDLSESFYVDYDFPIRPILRPLSSMTKEEAKEFMMLALSYCVKGDSTLLDFEIKTDKVSGITISYSISDVMFNHIHTINTYSICVCGDFIKIMDKETGRAISVNYSLYEWLFKNHFDVFGLIDKGLAVEKG